MVQLDYPETGSIIEASDHRNRMGFMLSNQISSFLDGATSTNQENLKLDLFGSDTAQYLSFMSYNAGTDLYECDDTSTAYYVIIEATSTTAAGTRLISPGKWMVYASGGTYEANRASIMSWLFKGALASNVISNFTNITALKTKDSRDIGKQMWAVVMSYGSSEYQEWAEYTADFSDTSTNTDCSSWSDLSCVDYLPSCQWYLPSGTTLNSCSHGNSDGTTTSNEIGIDTSADEYDNPANIKLRAYHGINGYGGSSYMDILILSKGGLTNFAVDYSSNAPTVSNYDYTGTGSIPVFTTITESDLTCSLTTASTTITTSETMAIVKSLHTLTAGNTLAYEVTFDDGSNWQTVTESALSQITNTGTSFRVRMTITRATNTETDSITSYGAYYS